MNDGRRGSMRLLVLLPGEKLLDVPVEKVTTEGAHGSFTLLPRHIDFVTAVVPGILSYFDGAGEHFVAVDWGVLVKECATVRLSCANAARGGNLGELERLVRDRFLSLEDRDRVVRSAMARLEGDFVRRMSEL